MDEFLRFLAANALTSNLESFFALGHNYYLYLDPKTNKFVFIPGDLEFSLANFLLMGIGRPVDGPEPDRSPTRARTSWRIGCSRSRRSARSIRSC